MSKSFQIGVIGRRIVKTVNDLSRVGGVEVGQSRYRDR